MDTPLLSIDHLCASMPNGQTHLLNDVSFEVRMGETLALVGESGSGKSITALSIPGLLRDTGIQLSGSVRFNTKQQGSVDLLTLSQRELNRYRGKEIGMIFQEPMSSLNPLMTCGEQVAECIRNHFPVSRKQAIEQTIELFKQVELPDPAGMTKRYPHQLSGGQKQRVMIAIAISCNPSLLIADEPTTALDVTVQKSILELLRSLQKTNGMGLLFITHDLGVVSDLADRVAVLYRGELLETQPTDQLFNHPIHPYTRALLACRPGTFQKGQPLPTVEDMLKKNKNEPFVFSADSQTITSSPDRTNSHESPLLSVRNLNVSFSSRGLFGQKAPTPVLAVNDLSFDLYEGETVGLVGESGSGKTTLGRTILRLQDATSGQVLFKEKDLLSIPAGRFRSYRKELQIVFQDPYASLNPRIRVGDMLLEPMLLHRKELSPSAAKKEMHLLLKKVGLEPDIANRYPHAFSGGQRQRLVIARALSVRPSLIVWDESVSALDASIQAQILNLINELKREFQFTSLFITHDLSVVRYLCDRILILQNGRIVESGEPAQIWSNPQHPYTRQLLEAIPGKKAIATSE